MSAQLRNVNFKSETIIGKSKAMEWLANHEATLPPNHHQEDRMTEHQIEIFETTDGQTQIQVRFDRETIWLSQAQMAKLFDKDSDTIGLHLKNIYQTNELNEQSTTEESSVVQQVAPHAGAWIETTSQARAYNCVFVAPHAGAWIETEKGAWIETLLVI